MPARKGIRGHLAPLDGITFAHCTVEGSLQSFIILMFFA